MEVGSERFECAEALFHPQLLCALDKHCSPKGIHYAVADTINSLDSIGRDIQLPDLTMVVLLLTVNAGLMFVLCVRHRSELSRNILLIGATARLSGLSARLQQEVDKLITTGTLAARATRDTLAKVCACCFQLAWPYRCPCLEIRSLRRGSEGPRSPARRA